MSKIISQTQITAAIHRAQATIKADVTGLQNISLNLQPLGSVLQNISSAGYLSGIKATGDVHPQQGIQNISNTAAIASSTNWDQWKPGDAAAAAQTADGGLADLLAAQGAVIKGIGDTTLTRIGNVISDGLAQGSSVDQISRDIRDFLDNPDRADMIATTEANRAQTAAASEQLDAMGFTQFNWLAYDGACDDCLEQESFNPHDLSDDQPPGHPNCRCAITGDGEAGLPDTGTSDAGDSTGIGANLPDLGGSTPDLPEITPPADAPTDIERPSTSGQVTQPDTGPVSGPTAPANTQFSFKTMDDAVTHFNSIGVEINGDDMTAAKIRTSHLEEVAGALRDAEIKTPGLEDQLTKITVAPDGSRYLAAISYFDDQFKADRWFELTGERYGTQLQITKKLARTANSPTELKKMVEGGTGGQANLITSLRDIYTHEFGHVLQRFATEKQDLNLGTSFRGDGILARAMRESGYLEDNGVQKKLEDGTKITTNDVSTYSGTNAYEFHSEVQVLMNDPGQFYALSQDSQDRLLKYQSEVNKLAGFDMVKNTQTTTNKADPKSDASKLPSPTVIEDDFGLGDDFYSDVDQKS